MKYDILVQTFTSSRWFKTIFAKNKSHFFSPKIGDIFFCQNPFLAIIRLKKRKKSGMDHLAIGVGRVKP